MNFKKIADALWSNTATPPTRSQRRIHAACAVLGLATMTMCIMQPIAVLYGMPAMSINRDDLPLDTNYELELNLLKSRQSDEAAFYAQAQSETNPVRKQIYMQRFQNMRLLVVKERARLSTITQ